MEPQAAREQSDKVLGTQPGTLRPEREARAARRKNGWQRPALCQPRDQGKAVGEATRGLLLFAATSGSTVSRSSSSTEMLRDKCVSSPGSKAPLLSTSNRHGTGNEEHLVVCEG